MAINKIDGLTQSVNATKSTASVGAKTEVTSNVKIKDSIEFSNQFNKIQSAINSINNQDISIDKLKIAAAIQDIKTQELGMLSQSPQIKLSTASRIAAKILEDF